MGLFDSLIKEGLNRAVNDAVSNTLERKITEAIEPEINKAVNKAADTVLPPKAQEPADRQEVPAAGSQAQWGGLFSGLAGGLQNFANEAAKNMKICAACGEGANADTKFCPKCGAELPEQTVAQGALCQSCGKQNDIGVKFCAACGAKLPSAIAEEKAAKAKDDEVITRWDTLLPKYPKWCFGGHDLGLEKLSENDNGSPYYGFFAGGVGSAEVEQYRQLLKQNGFRPAGQYPDESQLFKRIDNVVYNADIEHAFEVSEHISLYFTVRETSGGFDYVKPEPKKPLGLKGLFSGK